MDAAVSNRTVMAALYRTFESLCNGAWSAVRVACVPNGAENRFVVRIEPEWRNAVYSYLAEHSAVQIPPDGGALNLSAEEAVQLGTLHEAPSAAQAERTSRRIASELRNESLHHTLQP